MRIQFGPPQANTSPGIEPDAGQPIRQPGRWTSAILATLAGMVLLSVPVAVSIAYSVLFSDPEAESAFQKTAIPWAGILIFIILCIIAHKILHALLHPGFGFTDSTVLFLGWKKLRFGVYYEGLIPRARWIAMRLIPLLVLTLLPLAAILIFFGRLTYAWETYLIILILTNSLGSGGDLIAVAIVLRQVPAKGVLNFHRGRAYWLPADAG